MTNEHWPMSNHHCKDEIRTDKIKTKHESIFTLDPFSFISVFIDYFALLIFYFELITDN